MKLFKKKEKYLPVSIQFDAYEKKKNMVKKPIPVSINMQLTPNELQVVKHILYEINNVSKDYLFHNDEIRIYKYPTNMHNDFFLINTDFKVNGYAPRPKKFIEDRDNIKC